MTAEASHRPECAGEDLVTRRLRLDIEDLRFENARLKASIAARQDEIVALSERLGRLQAEAEARHHARLWTFATSRLASLSLLLRRR